MTQICFTRRFSMAHRLLAERSSKCATPHGHNEFVKVTLKALKPTIWGSANYSASFEDLKRHWHGFIDHSLDHALQLGSTDPLIDYFKTHEPDIMPRLLVIKGDPTTEAVATCLYQKLNAILAQYAPDFICTRLELEETPTNTIVIERDELSDFHFGDWCQRADLSMNDLIAPSEFGSFS